MTKVICRQSCSFDSSPELGNSFWWLSFTSGWTDDHDVFLMVKRKLSQIHRECLIY